MTSAERIKGIRLEMRIIARALIAAGQLGPALEPYQLMRAGFFIHGVLDDAEGLVDPAAAQRDLERMEEDAREAPPA